MNENFEKSIQHIKKLGELRDGILVCAGIIYCSGYFAWSLIAWQNKLGQMPVFDAQYFVAGMPILASIIIIVYISKFTKTFFNKYWPSWIIRKKPAIRKSIYALLFLLGSSFLIILPVHNYFPKLVANYRLFFNISSILGLISFVFLYFSPLARKLEEKAKKDYNQAKQRLPRIMKWSIPREISLNRNLAIRYIIQTVVFLVILFNYSYITNFYFVLPQELGGAKPRRAILDVVTKNISRKTSMELGIDKALYKVGRTRVLNIFYSGKDNIIFSIRVKDQQIKDQIFFELAKSSVKAIKWIK